MIDAVAFFGFISFFCIYIIGMILVILNKLELETDSDKEKKLLYSLYGIIFFALFMSVSLVVGYFCGTDDNSGQYQMTPELQISLKDDQQISQQDQAIFKYAVVLGFAVFQDMIMLVPIIWLISMFKAERENDRQKRLLHEIYFIISLPILQNIVIFVICFIYTL
jgi:hypothetical protein